MKLRLTALELTNYRLYKGHTRLEFGNNDNKNVTIVLGKNGAGKSTLLNALTWCFYGIEAHTDGSKTTDSMPIINTTVLSELRDGESTDAEVTLTLEIDGNTSQISRSVTATKFGSQISFSPVEFKVYTTNASLQTETYGDREAENYIESLLPGALSNFFFIDGEQLRTFFQISTPEKIEDAIEKLSKLDVIQAAINSLSKYYSEQASKCKPTSTEANTIKADLSKCNQLIDIYKDKLKGLEAEIKRLSKKEEELIKYLNENDDKTIANLSNQREAAKAAKKLIDSRYREAVDERNYYLSRIAPFIYLKETLSGAYDVMETLVERGELPEKIREIFIEDLLKGEFCICGNKIGEEERAKLQEYAKNLRRAGLGDIAIQGRMLIKQILDDIADFPDTIDDKNNTIDLLQSQSVEQQDIIDETTNELKKYNAEDIKSKNDELRDVSGDLKVARNDFEKNKDGKENKEKIKSQLEQRLQALLQKDEAQRVIGQKLELANKAKETLIEVERRVKSKILNLLESNTEETFLSLERKKDAFKRVTIDSKYNVTVHHKDGYNALNNLSAGEYLLLGLSFMYALRSISGYRMPVVIDTPLGKIDDEHRDNITQQLPELLNGSQLILLVTPTEYDPKVKKNLSKYISKGAGYEIKENEDQTAATLEVMI